MVRPGLDGILIPKVNGMQDIELISNYLDALEVAAGVTPGHVKLLVVATETPAAMIGFASYATPNRAPGGHDLGRRGSRRRARRALEQGSQRRLDVSLSDGAGTMPVCRWSGGRRCRSTPCMRISGTRRGWRESCRIARRDGFVGRIAIHPDQIATINECFTPSEADLAHARRVVAAFAAQPDAGTLGIDGKMYDMPHLIAAKRALASAGEDIA